MLLCGPRSSGYFLLIDVRDSQLSLLQLPSILVRHVCSLFLLSFLSSLSRKTRSSVVVSAQGLMCVLLLSTLKCLMQLKWKNYIGVGNSITRSQLLSFKRLKILSKTAALCSG